MLAPRFLNEAAQKNGIDLRQQGLKPREENVEKLYKILGKIMIEKSRWRTCSWTAAATEIARRLSSDRMILGFEA